MYKKKELTSKLFINSIIILTFGKYFVNKNFSTADIFSDAASTSDGSKHLTRIQRAELEREFREPFDSNSYLGY
jgi:hypothetical protein